MKIQSYGSKTGLGLCCAKYIAVVVYTKRPCIYLWPCMQTCEYLISALVFQMIVLLLMRYK